MDKLFIYNERKLGSTNMWLLFLLLGWSYGSMGNMGKQILFYVTFGGLGIWSLYVLFTLNDKVKQYNKDIAIQAGFSNEELLMMGLM